MIKGKFLAPFFPHRPISKGAIVTFVAVWIMSGCVGWQQRPTKMDVSPAAQVMIERLAGQNHTLSQFKGLGAFHLNGTEGRLSGRMGWACIRPDRFRAGIFDFGGRPITTVASDGSRIYFRLRGEEKIHQKSARKANLEHLTGTPVAIGDMIAFLSGQIPIHAYQKARVIDSENGPALTLTSRRGHRVETVYFYEDGVSPRQVRMYTRTGADLYQVDIGRPSRHNGYEFFSTLTFSEGQDNHLKIKLDKIWVVDHLPVSIFTLKNP